MGTGGEEKKRPIELSFRRSSNDATGTFAATCCPTNPSGPTFLVSLKQRIEKKKEITIHISEKKQLFGAK